MARHVWYVAFTQQGANVGHTRLICAVSANRHAAPEQAETHNLNVAPCCSFAALLPVLGTKLTGSAV